MISKEIEKKEILDKIRFNEIPLDEGLKLIDALKENDYISRFKLSWDFSYALPRNINKITNKNILIFISSEQMENYGEILENNNVLKVYYGDAFEKLDNNSWQINEKNKDHYDLIFNDLKSCDFNIDIILNTWNYSSKFEIKNNKIEDDLYKNFYSLVFTYQMLIKYKFKNDTKYYYLYEIEAENAEKPIDNALSSLMRSLQMENSKFTYKSIGVLDSKLTLEDIVSFEIDYDKEFYIKYKNNKRYIKQINPLTDLVENKDKIKYNGVYVFVGGDGGIGKILIDHISKKYKSSIIVIGRTSNNSTNSNIKYIKCDITDEKNTKTVFEYIKNEYKTINGVFYLASVLNDGLMLNKDVKLIKEVVNVKIKGVINVYKEVVNCNLDFFAMFSSISAITGSIGQAEYSFANAFLNEFTDYINKNAGENIAVSINMPYWKEGGMKIKSEDLVEIKKKTGMEPISNNEGVKEVFKAINGRESQYIFTKGISIFKNNRKEVMRKSNAMKENDLKTDLSIKNSLEMKELTNKYLMDIISKEIRKPANKIKAKDSFQDLGIDSIIIMDITRALEKDFGMLSKTLFFEYSTIDELSTYFLNNHVEILQKKFNYLDKKGGSNDFTASKKTTNKESKMQKKELVVTPHDKRDSKTTNNEIVDDIAIIGMSGRYPMAENIDIFWNNLKEGKNCITEIPMERWDYRKYFSEDKNTRGKTYSKWGGFIEDYDKFDPLFFKISPRESDYLDPQERVFLECAWSTMEDAGYTRDKLNNYKVGVYVGVMYGHYQLYNVNEGLNGEVPVQSSSYASIANRVSYALNLNGASVAVDTMCSSSLTAIHLACQSILNGENEISFAGGVNISSHPLKYIMLSQQKFMSTDGKCRSFGDGGDGYVPGEGVGAVLLKSLSLAEKDGDKIYGVIKSSSLNHDGRTRGYSVPNPNAQTEVIKETLNKANINSKTISYIEAHGTGTALGDPIEITGLMNAFAGNEMKNQECSIGSVKSNIGHGESASGVAGVMKILLQMKHKLLVPSIHSSVLNKNIDFANSPFYVQQKLQPWETKYTKDNVIVPRRAGINSFGAGGSNAFVLLEEYDDKRNYYLDDNNNNKLITISARNEEGLRKYISRLVTFLENNKRDSNLDYEVKILDAITKIIADNIDIPLSQIAPFDEFDTMGMDYIDLEKINREISDLYKIDSLNISIYENINEIQKKLIKDNYEEIKSYYSTSEGMDNNEYIETPNLTEIAYMLQTGREQMEVRFAVVVSSIDELKNVLNKYINYNEVENSIYLSKDYHKNDFILNLVEGESGELFLNELFARGEFDKIAKIWCSGVDIAWDTFYEGKMIKKCSLPTYQFKKEVHWVPRKLLSSSSNKGKIHPLIDEYDFEMSIENGIVFKKVINSFNLVVKDHKVKDVNVLPGVAYLEMVYESLDIIGKKDKFKLSSIFFVNQLVVKSNVDSTVYVVISRDNNRYEFNVKTIEKGIEVLHCKGNLIEKNQSKENTLDIKRYLNKDEYVNIEGNELYPLYAKSGIVYGEMYQGLKNLKVGKNEVLALINVAPNKYNVEDYYMFPGMADSALQAVAPLNSSDETRLPYYIGEVQLFKSIEESGYVYVKRNTNDSFDEVITDVNGEVCVKLKDVTLRKFKEEPEDFLFYPKWNKSVINNKYVHKNKDNVTLLVYSKKMERLAASIKKQLNTKKTYYIELADENKKLSQSKYSVDSTSTEMFKECLESIQDIKEIYFLGMTKEINDIYDIAQFKETQDKGVVALFDLVKELISKGYDSKKLSLNIITNNSVKIEDNDIIIPYFSSVHGFTLSMAKEFSKWNVSCVDVDLLNDKYEYIANQILIESNINNNDLVVYRNRERFIRNIYPINISRKEDTQFRENGVYIIIGGAGGIGTVLSKYLSEKVHAKIVMVGRKDINDEIKEKIKNVKHYGGDAIYVKADLLDEDSIINMVEETKEKFGSINGVIHSALVLKDKTIARMTRDTFLASLNPKAEGSILLNKALKNEKLDFMLYFSSANTYTASVGQSNYSAGCTFEDSFAEYQNDNKDYPVKYINWGYWGTVGIVSTEQYVNSITALGVKSIEPEEGMNSIEILLGNKINNIIPYKAKREVLEKFNIKLEEVIDVYDSENIYDFEVIDSELSDEFKTKIEEKNKNFAKFESLGSLLLLKEFNTMGFFNKSSDVYTKDEIKEKIGLLPGYTRLFNALINILERSNFIEINNETIKGLDILDDSNFKSELANLYTHVDKVLKDHESIKPYISLIRVCVEAYPKVLNGTVNHMNVMFPNGSKELVENIYKGNIVTDYFNEKMADIVEAYIIEKLKKDKYAQINIVEIGAGTGGTSISIFKKINVFKDSINYYYTDISKSFIEYGRRNYGQNNPYAKFQLLNIENDPISQGFDKNSIDIILATNVLHATKSVDNTLTQSKKIMKNNGIFIINEITHRQDYATLTFGLTDGWWLYEDEKNRIDHSPLLDIECWKKVMNNNGFNNFKYYGLNGVNDKESEQSIIIAQSNGININKKLASVLNKNEELIISKSIISKSVTNKPENMKLLPNENMVKYLKEVFAKILNMNINDINENVELENYGVDSLVAMEIIKELDKVASDIPATIIFDYPTISHLAKYLIRRNVEIASADKEKKFFEDNKSYQVIKNEKSNIVNKLREVFAKVLNISEDQIDNNASLDNYGVDSLIIMDVNKEISGIYGEISIATLFENFTINKFSDKIMEIINTDKSLNDNYNINLINVYKGVNDNEFNIFWKELKVNNNEFNSITVSSVDELNNYPVDEIKHFEIEKKNKYKLDVIMKGQGDSVLFISGYGFTNLQWKKQIDKFSNKHKVIAISAPGFGISKTNDTITLKNVANAFIDVLEFLKINDSIKIVAASFGSMIAQYIAAEYKQKVSSIVLLAGFSTINEKFKESSVNSEFTKETSEFKKEDLEILDNAKYVNSNITKYYESISMGNVFETKSIINKINVPALIINGDKDNIVDDKEYNLLNETIKDSKLVIIKNAGHALNVSNANEVNNEIQLFWNEKNK